MDAWLVWKILVASIILVESSESCSTVYDGSLDEVTEGNTNSPWLVLVSNQLGPERCWIHGISYGSLIKEDVVLTAASKVTRFSPSDLEIMANFRLTDHRSCDSRSVLSIYSRNFNKNPVKPSDWAVLILKEPFKLYDKVGIIPLADKNHPWDPENCLIYHWMAVKTFKQKSPRKIIEDGILHQEHLVSLTPGSSGLYESEKIILRTTTDCIIEECFISGDNEKIFKNISFVGSPIVCKLVNQEQYIQVGFTSFISQIIVEGSEDDISVKDISEYDEDNFVDLTKDFEEIIKPNFLED